MIARTLLQVVSHSATVVLITHWWPMQPWFPMILHRLGDLPRLITMFPDLLLSSLRNPHPLIIAEQLPLLASLVSGDSQKIQNFRRRLETSSRTLGLQVPSRVTDQPGKFGFVGALNDIWIPLRHL